MDKQVFLNNLSRGLQSNISINEVMREMNNFICPLTRSNADLIEEFINHDPEYPNGLEPIIENLGILRNGSAYSSICNALNRHILEDFIWKVAILNSVQGKRQSVKVEIANFITEKGPDFYRLLKEGNLELVQKMERFVYENTSCLRHECSWCSKVVKYLHDYLFGEDKYYIFDSNVVARLNDYRKYYGLRKVPKNDIDVHRNEHWYENLSSALDEIVERIPNEHLKRSEVDHILWGFAKYKIDLVRVPQ